MMILFNEITVCLLLLLHAVLICPVPSRGWRQGKQFSSEGSPFRFPKDFPILMLNLHLQNLKRNKEKKISPRFRFFLFAIYDNLHFNQTKRRKQTATSRHFINSIWIILEAIKSNLYTTQSSKCRKFYFILTLSKYNASTTHIFSHFFFSFSMFTTYLITKYEFHVILSPHGVIFVVQIFAGVPNRKTLGLKAFTKTSSMLYTHKAV